jgi:hypothetical protein
MGVQNLLGRRQMIECHENEDGSLLITWDKNDPVESQLNTWTEDDFVRAIMDEANLHLKNETI